MQQYCLISLRYKNPLHKHIHNFTFPDGQWLFRLLELLRSD